MHHWANDFVGMPGRFFSQLAKGLYGQNELLKGEFRVKGRRGDLRNIHQPLLAIAVSHDHIVPPRAAQGLLHAVSSYVVATSPSFPVAKRMRSCGPNLMYG